MTFSSTGFADFTIGRPWWEKKFVNHPEGPNPDPGYCIRRPDNQTTLNKTVLGKIKKESCIFPMSDLNVHFKGSVCT